MSKPKTETWRLYTYDLWGNDQDGYEVNDIYQQEQFEVEFTGQEEDEVKRVIQAGIDQDILSDPTMFSWQVDPQVDNTDGIIYLVGTDNQQPMGELRRI